MRDLLVVIAVWLIAVPAGAGDPEGDPEGDIEVLMDTISVSGREELAAVAVLERLALGAEGGAQLGERDALGSVVVTLGEGAPRRLVACGLDEPGFVISEIRPDGYLRVRRAGFGGRGALWPQGFQGQKVWISTVHGRVAAAVAIPSIHLMQHGSPPDEPFSSEAAFLDVGAESASEVRQMGIALLDPVGLQQRRTSFGDLRSGKGLIAGPSAQGKAACAALIAATRGLASGEIKGTLVVAWLRLELWNRTAIVHLLKEEGPFDEVLLSSRGFGWASGPDGIYAGQMPDIGSGPLTTGGAALPGSTYEEFHLDPFPAWYSGGPDWGSAQVRYFAVPTRYWDSPVETVARSDIDRLADALVGWAGKGEVTEEHTPTAVEPVASVSPQHQEPADRLAELIATYGVSTREEATRREVREHLPDWAEPVVDERGNLVVQFGSGTEHVAFVAHLDEVGFVVEEVLDDGRLQVRHLGGLATSAWEAQSAIVHTSGGEVRGVFEPREGWLETEVGRPSAALTVYIGRNSREETAAAGIHVGDAVTMPKQMRRLGHHRAVARSFDDRVGSTAQLLALSRLDPESVDRRYTFAWVVEEEIGLFGSIALADGLDGLDRVHPVDTFVSSDDPYPDTGFALAPLGQGVVLRAMDNGFLADRDTIEYVLDVASRHGIPTQIGFTGGGNDGIAFIHHGVTNLPLSWPGRYSHSPAEVMDLRDLESLVDLIVALVEDPAP